jgi:hypothetical protein
VKNPLAKRENGFNNIFSYGANILFVNLENSRGEVKDFPKGLIKASVWVAPNVI